MTNEIFASCVNCGRTEQEVPLGQWHYQRQAFSLCADCLPLMIHKRPVIMAKLGSAAAAVLPPEVMLDDPLDLRAL